MNLLASGLAPPEVQPFLAGAYLIGLSKKDGGIRPIAIGDIYRRLTGKCLSSLVKEEANCFFLPAQCVCAPGGGEAVVHAWRHLMEEFKNNPEFIGMKIDFVNAFNSVKRIVLLNECFEKFPHIYKWVHFCYSQHSHLFFGDYIISSQAGVQQGDPLGPLLFCLVLHVLVSKLLNESPGLALNNWYMDDGSLFGKIEDVLKAWKLIKEMGPELGLFSNLEKCELISTSGNSNVFDDFEPQITKISNGNMTILGSAIGCKQHCEDWVSHKLVKKLPILLSKLIHLGHAQSSFLLLLYCASFCKMVWFIRTIPPDLISEACEQFDSSVLNCFENLIGSGLSVHSLNQARLGTKSGGIGLRASKTHSAAAYISSFFMSKSLVETFIATDTNSPYLENSITAFNTLVSKENQLDASSCPSSQQDLSSKIDFQSFTTLLSSSDALHRARLLACTMPHANAWIRALPCHQKKFLCLEWTISMKRWLGCPLFNSDHLCVACNEQIMDVFGHHATVCAVKGDRIKRHNQIRDILFDFCSCAAWGPSKEKPNLFSYSSEKPADVFVPNYTCGKDLVLDVAVTCPLQHKYLHDASVIAGFACNDYAVQVKMKNFQERVEQEGFIYLPVIFESFGGFSEDFSSFVHKLSISVSARLNEVKSATQKHLYELISCVLMKSLARSVSSRFQEFCS